MNGRKEELASFHLLAPVYLTLGNVVITGERGEVSSATYAAVMDILQRYKIKGICTEKDYN